MERWVRGFGAIRLGCVMALEAGQSSAGPGMPSRLRVSWPPACVVCHRYEDAIVKTKQPFWNVSTGSVGGNPCAGHRRRTLRTILLEGVS